MKESMAKHPLPRSGNRLRPVIRGRGRTLFRGLACAVAAFVLSGAKLLGAPVPMAACLIGAFHPGFSSLCAALGAAGGYLAFTGGTSCAELVILSLLLLAAVVVFQGTELPQKIWFFPLMSAALWGLLRGIGLRSAEELPQWLLQMGLCACSSAVFRRAVIRDRRAMLLGGAAILWGLASLPLPVNLGLLLGSALCVSLGTPQLALALGLALDLTGLEPCCAVMAFCLPVILLQKLRKREMPLYALGFLLLSSLIMLLFSAAPAANCLCLGAGTALGMILHKLPQLHQAAAEAVPPERGTRLHAAAKVLRLLRQQLPQEAECPCESEAESVYDGAAERVCRCCERFRRCWGDRIHETCNALNSAARGIITAGTAKAEDFPPEFREQCCHLEGFVTAVNQELEGMLFRRQYRMRLRECALVVAQELSCLEDYLLSSSTSGELYRAGMDAYLPEIGLCSFGKNGAAVNGDRSRRFSSGGRYHILLCDGMGTGEAASRMSGETIELLEQLLKSGMSPENGLKLLNGAELLRGDDRFTTVDLLSIDLQTGQAELLKWGSAPSYYRSGETVKKIGTASPPPGVGVGGEHVPERYTLSLSGGELLVLRSDGACGEEIEEALGSYTGRSSVALAAYLVSGLSGEDDMTALTVSLRLHISS